jgi:arginyl-tRNA synthetase
MKNPAYPDLRGHCLELFAAALKTVAPQVQAQVVLEKPKQAQHGDYAC